MKKIILSFVICLLSLPAYCVTKEIGQNQSDSKPQYIDGTFIKQEKQEVALSKIKKSVMAIVVGKTHNPIQEHSENNDNEDNSNPDGGQDN